MEPQLSKLLFDLHRDQLSSFWMLLAVRLDLLGQVVEQPEPAIAALKTVGHRASRVGRVPASIQTRELLNEREGISAVHQFSWGCKSAPFTFPPTQSYQNQTTGWGS